MENNEKTDKELSEFIESLNKDETLSWEERMNRIIEWKKANRGLVGIKLSSYFSTVTVDEELAKGFVTMSKNEADGKFEDVTNETL